MDPEMESDLKALTQFIGLYCHFRHPRQRRTVVAFEEVDLNALAGGTVYLCDGCMALLREAVDKRMHCPMAPKPACSECPSQCHSRAYRSKIREIARYTRREFVLACRLGDIAHLIAEPLTTY
jgi:hypothetical protein